MSVWSMAGEREKQKARRDPVHALNFPADGIVDDIAHLTDVPAAIAINGATRSLERLEDWPPIDVVWASDMNASQFERAAGYLNPRSLYLGAIRTADFAPLCEMPRLDGLSLSINTKLDDISFIGAMTSLKRLSLDDIKKPFDLTPVSQLSQLDQLTLSGGIWNVLRVPSLEPLAHLKYVRHIELTNIRVGDQTLAPLGSVTALQDLYLSNQFPMEAYAWLAATRPDITCNKFAPYELFEIDGEQRAMLTGKGKPILQLDQKQRLQKHIDRWNELLTQYRSDLAAQ
ncbi:MAG: hypothetical protein AAF709_22175 [Pseudomonadota bacterium]